MGLTLELNPMMHDVAYVLQSNIAFRVFVLEPHNYATEDMQPIILGPNMEAFLSVIPRKITGDRAMADIDAESRGCFFFEEPTLVYEGWVGGGCVEWFIYNSCGVSNLILIVPGQLLHVPGVQHSV